MNQPLLFEMPGKDCLPGQMDLDLDGERYRIHTVYSAGPTLYRVLDTHANDAVIASYRSHAAAVTRVCHLERANRRRILS